MDSFEWNKIFGGVVATALVIQTINVASGFFFAPAEPAKPGYVVPGAAAEAPKPAEGGSATAEALPDFATAIPAADAMAGEMIAERCGACHDWMKDGPNKIGPNLYGVVGRKKASHAGFTYSPIMQSVGGDWTYPNLFEFLARPAVVMPGTKMTFAGLPRAQDRLNVIAFLRMQADTPAPLPAAGAAPPPAP